MAYNTVAIKKDIDGKPIPQHYNSVTNEFEALEGANGASKVIVYDANGNIIDLVALITSIVTAINTTGTTQLRAGDKNIGKVDVNTSVLPTGASTAAKQDELKGVIDTINNKDNTKTLYGLSTDIKPTTGLFKGDKYFEINTGVLNMCNGSTWVVV